MRTIFNLPKINFEDGEITTFVIAAQDIESLEWYDLSETMRTKLNDADGHVTIIRTRSGETVFINLNLNTLLREWAEACGVDPKDVVELS